jgi:hypothetical protein
MSFSLVRFFRFRDDDPALRGAVWRPSVAIPFAAGSGSTALV